MLGMKTYPKAYIAACRAKVDDDVRAYRAAVGKGAKGDFEAAFFNNMALQLDHMFVHRLSGIEGKDGNPLNEVRVITNSLLLNAGRLQVEKLPDWPQSAVSGLKLPPEKSVLKLKPGDDIKLTEADFAKLAKAFFAEIEKRYG